MENAGAKAKRMPEISGKREGFLSENIAYCISYSYEDHPQNSPPFVLDSACIITEKAKPSGAES